MKKLLTLLFISYSALSCAQSPTDVQKAKASVRTYLIKRLNNPASYKGVSWTKLKKTHADFEDSKKAKEIDSKLKPLLDGKQAVTENVWTARRRANGDVNKDSTYISAVNLEKEVNSAIDSLTLLRNKLEETYKPTFDGYIVEHSFRARNKFNALVLQNYVFILNKNFKVTSYGDVDESEREREDLQRRIDELVGGN